LNIRDLSQKIKEIGAKEIGARDAFPPLIIGKKHLWHQLN
jgi:hypothetical protein